MAGGVPPQKIVNMSKITFISISMNAGHTKYIISDIVLCFWHRDIIDSKTTPIISFSISSTTRPRGTLHTIGTALTDLISELVELECNPNIDVSYNAYDIYTLAVVA